MSADDLMATRHAAAARVGRAAVSAGAHPAGDALRQLAEDLNAPGDHPFWAPIAAALCPDVATEVETADAEDDLARLQRDLHAAFDPPDIEPGA